MALKFHQDLKSYINQTKFGSTRAIGIYVLNYQRKSDFIYPPIFYLKQHEAIAMFYLHLVSLSNKKDIKSKVRVVDQWFRSRYWTMTMNGNTGR